MIHFFYTVICSAVLVQSDVVMPIAASFKQFYADVFTVKPQLDWFKFNGRIGDRSIKCGENCSLINSLLRLLSAQIILT